MNNLLHTGIYSVPEVSRLTTVSTWRIRRWLKGYEFKVKTGRRISPPVWEGQLKPIDRTVALGFMDLIEVRCVDALLQAGVSWKTLRIAHANGRKMVGHAHPFCTNKLATDGQTVFLQMTAGCDEAALWDMKDIQRVFEKIIGPFLLNVEFSDSDVAVRWWPMGRDKQVVLDPRRSFGRPIVAKKGVPTTALAAALKTESDANLVAEWFGVSLSEIQDAADFEAQLAA